MEVEFDTADKKLYREVMEMRRELGGVDGWCQERLD